MPVNNSLRLIVLSLIASGLATSLPSSPAHAADEEQLKSGLENQGHVDLDFRYRYELVDQAGLAKDANASTLRTRLG